MPYTPEDYSVLKERHFQFFAAGLGEPRLGYTIEQITRLKEVFELLPHYDEYYSINDLRKLEFDWCYGVERVLGYDSKTWSHYDSIRYIHDDFRQLYLAFGTITYQILTNEKHLLAPEGLQQPYIINIPMRGKDGRFRWIKQLTMPLRLDENGMMVKQFNSYTSVSPYEDVFLPLCPRVFLKDGSEAIFLQKRVLELLITSGDLNFSEIQKTILRAYSELEQEESRKEEREEKRKGKGRVAIPGSDIRKKITLSPKSFKKQAQTMIDKMRKAYGVTFPNIYHLAMFFKPLYYVDSKVNELNNI